MSKRSGSVKSAGYGRPGGSKGGSKTSVRSGAGGGKQQAPKSAADGGKAPPPAPPAEPKLKLEKNAVFELPAISVLIQKKTDLGDEWKEKRKKKMLRRNVPPGEDTQKLKEILRSLKDEEINIHEFMGLITPFTGDQAVYMRNVLAEEMASFRKMCRRVYDTMTQDVSDVLANEQVQLTDNCNSRIACYSDKMMRSIDEIFAYIPDFDFEKYYEDDQYLKSKFPLCSGADGATADEEETLMRQEAFHRYQWLRSEGDRLSAENARLQERLTELKKQQKDELRHAQEIQAQSEERREQLEATEEALQEQVEDLNKSIEQSIVENEVNVMKRMKKASKHKSGSKEIKATREREMETRPEWNVGAAQAVEELATEVATQGQMSQVSVSASTAPTASTGAVRKQLKKPTAGKKKARFQRPKPPPQDTDAFHYSPPKTPPGYEMQEQQRSPFHYSPDRGGSRGGGSPRGRLPGQPQTPEKMVRMETSTTVMEPTRIPTGPQYSHHHSTNLW